MATTDNKGSTTPAIEVSPSRRPVGVESKKRWVQVAIAFTVLVVVVSSLFSDKPPVKAPAKPAVIELNPKGIAEKATWQSQSQADIAKLSEKMERMDAENKRLRMDLDSKNAAANAAIAKPTSGFGNMAALPPPPPPPLPAKVAQAPASAKLDALSASNPAVAGEAKPSADYVPSSGDSKPIAFDPPKVESKVGVVDEDVKSSVKYKKNDYAGFLPAGAFSDIVLLHGMDAGTSASVQSNPQPVLLRIQDNAVLPGSSKYDLKSCFALGSSYGDMSSERVYVRLAKLSCMDKAGKLVLSVPAEGYVVDSDGKLGLRGKLIDRQGTKLAKALLAGFAQGLASVATAASTTTTSSALGAVNTITGGQAVQQAGLTGASSAANQLAAFYLKQAESVFPVISVDAARTGTLVFSNGLALAWNEADTLFKREVTPQTSNTLGAK